MNAASCLRLSSLSIALLAGPALAKDFLDESRTIAVLQSSTERFTFTVEKGGPYPHFDVLIQLTQGRASVRFLNPAGRRIGEFSAQVYTGSGPIHLASAPGVFPDCRGPVRATTGNCDAAFFSFAANVRSTMTVSRRDS